MNLNFQPLIKKKLENQFLSNLSKMINDSKKEIITRLSTEITGDTYNAFWHSRMQSFIDDYSEQLKEMIDSQWKGSMQKLIDEMEKTYQKNIGTKLSKVGVMEFGISPEYLLSVSQLSAELVKNIPDLLRQEITKQLQLSAMAGDTIHTISKKLAGTLEGYKGVFKTTEERAKTIARTEIMGVYSNVTWLHTQELGQKFPNTMKIWRTMQDERVRPTHWMLDGVKVKWDEPFIVGGAEMMYPRDPNGPAEERIQCRCYFDVEIPDEDIEKYLRGEEIEEKKTNQ